MQECKSISNNNNNNLNLIDSVPIELMFLMFAEFSLSDFLNFRLTSKQNRNRVSAFLNNPTNKDQLNQAMLTMLKQSIAKSDKINLIDCIPIEIMFLMFEEFTRRDFLNFRLSSKQNRNRVLAFFGNPTNKEQFNQGLLTQSTATSKKTIEFIEQLSPINVIKFIRTFHSTNAYSIMQKNMSENIDFIAYLLVTYDLTKVVRSDSVCDKLKFLATDEEFQNNLHLSKFQKENLKIMESCLICENAKILHNDTNNKKLYEDRYINLKNRSKDNDRLLNLSGLTLENIRGEARLTSEKFPDKDLKQCFVGKNLQYTNFQDSKITYYYFGHATLDYSNFYNATLNDIDFNNANAKNCVFDNTGLAYVNFIGTNLTNSSFRYATLYKSYFYKTNLTSANFIGVVTSDEFSDFDIYYSEWSTCQLDKTIFIDPSYFDSADRLNNALKKLVVNLAINNLRPYDRSALCCAIAKNIVDTFKASHLDPSKILAILKSIKKNNAHDIFPDISFAKKIKNKANFFKDNPKSPKTPREIIDEYQEKLEPDRKVTKKSQVTPGS